MYNSKTQEITVKPFDVYCPSAEARMILSLSDEHILQVIIKLIIGLKIDGLDRVSIPTKIVATFDMEQSILVTTYGV